MDLKADGVAVSTTPVLEWDASFNSVPCSIFNQTRSPLSLANMLLGIGVVGSSLRTSFWL